MFSTVPVWVKFIQKKKKKTIKCLLTDKIQTREQKNEQILLYRSWSIFSATFNLHKHQIVHLYFIQRWLNL